MARRDPSPQAARLLANESGPEPTARSRYEFLERETGFEPATLTLAT